MNQIIPVLVVAAAVVAMTIQLVRTLRSDGYGLRPPPRSHRGEVDLKNPYRSLV